MEQDQERKHVWPQENESIVNFENGGQSGYGLRENPKKSCRFSDSIHSNSSREVIHCKLCGKGFHSLRSLSAHTRHHAQSKTEERTCKECGKKFRSSKALFGHMRCHSAATKVECQLEEEFSITARKKRSKTLRNKIDAESALPDDNSSSSSHDSEIDAEYEVALSLIMLSTSEVICKPEISSSNTGSSAKNLPASFEMGRIHEDGEFEKLESEVKYVHGVSDHEMLNLFLGGTGNEATEMGSLEDLAEEAELEQVVSELRKLSSKRARFEASDVSEKSHRAKHKPSNALESKSFKKGIKTERSVDFEADFKSLKVLRDSNSIEKEVVKGTTRRESESKKGKKHACAICFKDFASGKSLGGHMRVHYNRKTELGANGMISNGEFSDNSGEKIKDLECLRMVFPSSQASGCHMGVHFAANAPIRIKQLAIEEDNADMQNGLDLNLPALVEAKPWWIADDQKQESFAGLLSN